MSFWYLATPYSNFPGGIDFAHRVACQQQALLLRAKVPVFCPIAHTHPTALIAGIDPFDHEIWLPADRPMMDAAGGLILCKLPTWEASYGMAVEKEVFEAAGKPVVYMEPGLIPDLPML